MAAMKEINHRLMIEALREAISTLPAPDVSDLMGHLRRMFTPDEVSQILVDL
jgi:hypothetical protein